MSAEQPPSRELLQTLDNEELHYWAVVQRDTYAQHVFTVRFAPVIRLAALRFVGDVALAIEIEADTLRRVLMQANPVPLQSVAGFLLRVTRNSALNTLNDLTRKRRFVDSVDDFKDKDLKSVQSEEFVGLSLEDPDQYAQLQQALSQLRPDQCKALEMFYFEDLSYVAIADRLGVPVETVKSHLQNGRKRLLHLLKRD